MAVKFCTQKPWKPVLQNIKILAKNTFEPEKKDTLVWTESESKIKVVSLVKKAIFVEIIFAAITSEYGLLEKIFHLFTKEKNSIDVVAASGDSISFSCQKMPSQGTLKKIQNEIGEISINENKSILAIIGKEISKQPAFSKILSLISNNKPFVISKNSKDTNLTIVIENKESEELLKQIHELIIPE
jgi:aspartate kinase